MPAGQPGPHRGHRPSIRALPSGRGPALRAFSSTALKQEKKPKVQKENLSKNDTSLKE